MVGDALEVVRSKEIPAPPDWPKPEALVSTPREMEVLTEGAKQGQLGAASHHKSLAGWVIEVGRYQESDDAVQLLKRYKGQGLPAYLRYDAKAESKKYILLIGPELRKQEAQKWLNILASMGQKAKIKPYYPNKIEDE